MAAGDAVGGGDAARVHGNGAGCVIFEYLEGVLSGGALGEEQGELRMEGRWGGGEGTEQGMEMGRDQDAERGLAARPPWEVLW